MKLQERRRTSNTSKCGPWTGRCRGTPLPVPAAPGVRAWLSRGQLLLLMFSGLQRPAGSSKVAIKVDFDLAPDSFDDQYQGCSPQVMEELSRGDYFTKELKTHRDYDKVWKNAHLTWLNRAKELPKNMNITHAVALLVYTSKSNVPSDFIRAMANASRSAQQYIHSFHFKYLHYYLTSAIQLLRKEIVMKNDSLCFEVHHEMKDVYLEAHRGAIIRFGQFLSASLLKVKAQKFGRQTVFTIFTCLGAPVQEFSLKKEVLVPPYELFEVVNTSIHAGGSWLQLRSAGNLSTYNCQLLEEIHHCTILGKEIVNGRIKIPLVLEGNILARHYMTFQELDLEGPPNQHSYTTIWESEEGENTQAAATPSFPRLQALTGSYREGCSASGPTFPVPHWEATGGEPQAATDC